MHITSRQNPLIKHIRRLGADAAYRREQGVYLCDGRKLLTDALQSGVTPVTVIYSEGVTIPALPEETQLVTVPEALLESLSPAQTPQGVLFVCKIPVSPPAPPLKGRWLLLDRLQDPGNVGSVLRTAEAFAFDGVYLTPGCADPFSPKAVRAAMGAVFRLPVGTVPPEELLSDTLPLYAADMGGECGFTFSDGILALGNEGQGIGPLLRERADKVISIPMKGKAESLGVAAAAAILCYCVTR